MENWVELILQYGIRRVTIPLLPLTLDRRTPATFSTSDARIAASRHRGLVIAPLRRGSSSRLYIAARHLASTSGTSRHRDSVLPSTAIPRSAKSSHHPATAPGRQVVTLPPYPGTPTAWKRHAYLCNLHPRLRPQRPHRDARLATLPGLRLHQADSSP